MNFKTVVLGTFASLSLFLFSGSDVVKAQSTGAIPVYVSPATSPNSITPNAADSIADMVGVDTHYSANIPYNEESSVKTALDNSNIRHIRDGTPGTLPSNIHNGVALGLDKANPYNAGGNGAFSETQATVDSKLSTSTNPNADYIELCGNEQDNDSSTVNSGDSWPTMLKDCIEAETGWINAYYTANPSATRLPITAPSVENIEDEYILGQALGSDKNLIDYANFHPGTGALNPGILVSCTDTSNGRYGFPRCPSPYTNNTLQQVATRYAKMVSKTGKFFATEWGFSDKKNTTYVHCNQTPNANGSCTEKTDGSPDRAYVTAFIYNRVNGLPESQIAAYDPRSLLEWYRGGATRLYFYQFADVPTDCTFGAQGLITENMTPATLSSHGGLLYQNDDCPADFSSSSFTNTVTYKPEFYAVNNLIALYADPGSAYSPSTVSASISLSNGTNLHDLVAEKRNGTILVALWREETDYDWVGQVACTVGNSVSQPKIDYPYLISSGHNGGCSVTSEHATVSINGYHATRLDTFGSSGNVTYTTSNIPSTIPVATAYPVILELSHN